MLGHAADGRVLLRGAGHAADQDTGPAGGLGQHFFFDMGGGDAWRSSGSPTPPTACPASPHRPVPGIGELTSAVGSMNHVAFDVPQERFLEYRQTQGQGRAGRPRPQPRRQRGAVSRELHPGVFVRSFYFQDPDGILLEFACWVKEFTGPTRGTSRRPRPTAVARSPRVASSGTASGLSARRESPPTGPPVRPLRVRCRRPTMR